MNNIYTNWIDVTSSANVLYIFGVIIILIMVAECELDNRLIKNIIVSIALLIVVGTGCLSSRYIKLITYNKTIETKQLQLLPYEHVNIQGDTFIINNKKLKITSTDDTKYIKDSSHKPYLITEKVTYLAPNRWYVKNSSIKDINSKTMYLLKELHY